MSTTDTNTVYERVIAALRRRGNRVIERKPGETFAQCPAHDDRVTSLHLQVLDGQYTEIVCNAGCTLEAVGQALGLPLHVDEEKFRADQQLMFELRVEEQAERLRIRQAAKQKVEAEAAPEEDGDWRRWIDLGPYLEGTHVLAEPDVGGYRDDAIQVLYPHRWHTVIALTGAGKTAFALWHAKAVLADGGHVLYLHFEESEPDGVIERLINFGVSKEVIAARFHWADCSRRWLPGELAAWLAECGYNPDLAVLDGILAACTLHGWDHSDPSSIGAYRAMFVAPLVKTGAAVLSLGHPPKDPKRQNEIHGYGATSWLDEVDGVGFRMRASKEHPMEIGRKGYSELFVVKDRYSQVKRWGNLDTSKDQPWWYMGAFIVDDMARIGGQPSEVRLNVPPRQDGNQPPSKEAVLAGYVVEALKNRDGHRFEAVTDLKAFLAEDKRKYTASHLPVALAMLVNRGDLEWPEGLTTRSARPGWLTPQALATDSE
jgi:hypothetical protein